jgi:hypothetical protein
LPILPTGEPQLIVDVVGETVHESIGHALARPFM